MSHLLNSLLNKEQQILYNTQLVKVQQNQLLKSDPLVFESSSYIITQHLYNVMLPAAMLYLPLLIKYEYLQRVFSTEYFL